jgi:hypothetical protein
MTTMNTQLGVIDEVTYGTPVTVTRFFEYNTFGVKVVPGNTESKALRRNQRTARADRTEPYIVGAEGPVEFDVPTKGFGFWLKHMLGTVGTTGPTDANYVHTGTEGSLLGDFFTMQVNKPLNPAGTDQAHTFEGCKIKSWELKCDVDGVLVCTLEIDAEAESTAVGLATAVYPTTYRVFSWVGGSVTFAAGAVELKSFSVKCENNLDTDRRFLRGNQLKKEPLESGMRNYTWTAEAEHTALTNYQRSISTTQVGKQAAIVATFQGPIAMAGTTLPQLVVTIPAARFDSVEFDVSGPEGLMDVMSGVALSDGTNSPVSLAYTTSDVTP